jgi:hypothetical protein
MNRVNFQYERSDGASWGASSFYEAFETELARAIKSEQVFDTGWYSVKKEIESARIWRVGSRIHVEASVSNDFDEEGHSDGFIDLPESFLVAPDDAGVERIIEALKKEIDKTIAAAEENRDDDAWVGLYIVGEDQGPGMSPWKYTYLKDLTTIGSERPPGDYYHRWGWQEVDTDDARDHDAIPAGLTRETADKIRDAIHEGELPDEGAVFDGFRVRRG